MPFTDRQTKALTANRAVSHSIWDFFARTSAALGGTLAA